MSTTKALFAEALFAQQTGMVQLKQQLTPYMKGLFHTTRAGFTEEDEAETARRVNAYLHELSWGQLIAPEFFASRVLKTFEEESGIDFDEMVIVGNINFVSVCKHHLLPFYGIAQIGYLPDKSLLGLSKFARTVDYWAARFQTQEEMTVNLGTFLTKYLKNNGVGVRLKATHSCMALRGAMSRDSETVTTYLSGHLKTNPETRQEFLRQVS